MNAGSRTGRGWAYLGAGLGGAVSIAANVAHSYVPPPGAPADWAPHAGAVVGAVFWPVALFVAVEIFARTAWGQQAKWAALRWLGLLPVALVAAVVSYRHLSGLLAFYREDGLTATIGPLAVDGLMVMATGALIATAHRATVAVPVLATDPAPAATVTTPVTASATPAAPPAARTADATAAPTHDAKPVRSKSTARPPSAAKVAKAAARMPGASVAQIAARAGVSESTARRYLPAATTAGAGAVLASANPPRPAVTAVPAEPASEPIAA